MAAVYFSVKEGEYGASEKAESHTAWDLDLTAGPGLLATWSGPPYLKGYSNESVFTKSLVGPIISELVEGHIESSFR